MSSKCRADDACAATADFSAAADDFPADAQAGLRRGAELQRAANLTPYRRALPARADAITSSLTPDDIIGRVFATFCVGK